MKKNYKAILFDWAGVIGSDGYWLWLKANVPNLEQHKQAMHDISVHADRGEISGKEFMRQVGALIGRDGDEVLSGFLSLVKIDTEVVRTIRELRHKFKVGLLSNFVFEWLDLILKKEDLYSLFDANVISSAHRVVKPGPAAFNKILQMLGVSAQESLFVDDRQMHVDGATRVGIDGILFESAHKLREDLTRLGVL